MGGHYVWGGLDRSKEFADLYDALNLDSFSSETDDDIVLKPTLHSKKTNKEKKSKTPPSYFNVKCGCGCGLYTRAAMEKLGETKRGETDWDR